jgi:phage-related protein
VTDAKTWTAEFYEDSSGKRRVETWMAGLNETEFEALATAIEEILEKLGIELASTPWLKALGEGLHEFRVRHDAGTIRALYTDSGAETPTKPAKILLRLFVHFHGDKVILLLHGYNKGRDDSPRRQNREIDEARKRLRAWRAAQTREAKKPTPKKKR